MQFAGLAERVASVRERIAAAVERGGHGQKVEIVAVTKNHGVEAVQAAWDAGIRHVAENRVQEAIPKMDQATAPVAWHLVGHLQRNKTKYLDRFTLFHALDSARLADAVAEHAATHGSPVAVLVQVNASGEVTKGGFTLEELAQEAAHLRGLTGLDVRGVMTMAPFDAGEATLRATFRGCAVALQTLQDAGLGATELSMGMSSDYEVAVEEGATMVRLGTILFGARTP